MVNERPRQLFRMMWYLLPWWPHPINDAAAVAMEPRFLRRWPKLLTPEERKRRALSRVFGPTIPQAFGGEVATA